MSLKNVQQKNNEASTQFILKEYSYVQESEFYNRKNGDTRFNYYLTFISIFSAGLLTYWANIDQKSILEIKQFNVICLCSTILILFVGWQTFNLFITRWRLTIINLRKMAHIRKWFLDSDPAIKKGLVSGFEDTKPSFKSKKFFSSSLLTLIVFFNCIFSVLACFMVLRIIDFINLPIFYLYFLIPAIFLIGLLFHDMHYQRLVNKFEKDKFIAFPVNLISEDESTQNH